MLGVAMLLAAAYLGSRSLLLEWQRGARPGAGAVWRPARSRRVLVLYGLFVVYVLAMPIVGFPVATFAFAAAGMRATFGMPIWRSAFYGALLALLVQGLFGVGLGVPLPAGRLW